MRQFNELIYEAGLLPEWDQKLREDTALNRSMCIMI